MILVFAGAGTSKATSPEKYPTTLDFYRKLPGTIAQMPLFRVVDKYLKRAKGGTEFIDIEEVLWTLEDLRIYAGEFVSGRNLLGAIFQDPELAKIISPSANPRVSLEFAASLTNGAFELSKAIDVLVYDLYAQSPTPDELALAWAPILRGLLSAGHWIELFTTNYDLVIEEAIEAIEKDAHLTGISTGRTVGMRPHLHLGTWTEFNGDYSVANRGGIFTKLHGSIDWSKSGDTIHVGTPLFTGDTARHIIIYPGAKDRKGTRLAKPFDLFHEHFAKAVSAADTLVFLGFSFRDDRINASIRSNVRAGAMIFVIDPSPLTLEGVFPNHTITHIKDGFNKVSVAQVLTGLEERRRAASAP
jgi:hypothetical protein